MDSTCPNCGYCPHCKRSGHHLAPVYPLYPPVQPQPWWWYQQTIWTIPYPQTTGTITVTTGRTTGSESHYLGDNLTPTAQ